MPLHQSPSLLPVIVEAAHQLLQTFVIRRAKTVRSHKNPQTL